MSFDKSEALRIAEQHSLKGDISAAITVYRKIIENDPYDFNSINKLGDLYVGAGRIKDAINEFSRIADLHLTGGSATRAAYLLKKTLEFDPSNAPVRMKLGEVYSRENMMESAHEAFILAGSAFMRSGEIGKALEANQKALAIKPDSQQAKAAIATLENEAALNESKYLPDQAKPTGSQPVTDSDSESHEAKRKQATTSLDHLLSGFDDDYVVHRISKAEALVSFGDIHQAVSMLKEVLHSAPDNIAIHIKLKDIYLRAEMMDDACFEYEELARIYAARGESARAKDYEVRAQRLSQMIAPSDSRQGAQASRNAEKAEPQPAASDSVGSNNQNDFETRKASDGMYRAVDDTARKIEKVAAATARQASATEPTVEPQTLDGLFNSTGSLKLQAQETALACTTKAGKALASAPVASSSFPAASVLGLTLIENQPPVERKRRRWLYMTPVIIFCLTAGAVSVIKGYSMYESRLNRQYEELIHAGSLKSWPDLPQTPVFDEAENVDKDMVMLDPQPTQVVKSSESATDQPEIRNAEPKLTSEPKAAPVIINESPKANRPPALSPPLIAPTFDTQGGGDSPANMSAGVPEHPAVAAPMPALPRKASVTIPGEAVRRVQPNYPPSARSARQGGAVSVEIIINESGDVVSARAVSGSDLLRDAAVSAAKGWKFKPSLRDGKPVKSTSTITFNFKL